MKFPLITTKQEFDEHFRNEIWFDAARQICLRHSISFNSLIRSEHGEHIVFLVDDAFVIKIYRPFRKGFAREKAALEFASGKTSLKVPEIFASGEFEDFNYLVSAQFAGELMTRQVWLTLPKNEQIAFVRKLAIGLKELHSLNADSFRDDWREFVETQANITIERQIASGVNGECLRSLPAFLETNLKLLPENCPTVFLHGDVHFGNLRVQKSGGEWQISGLFDFADSRRGFHEYDFLAVGLLMIQGQADVQREFFISYGYREKHLDESFRKRMMMLTMLYETSDLRRYALRLKPEAVDFSLEELERAIWSFAN